MEDKIKDIEIHLKGVDMEIIKLKHLVDELFENVNRLIDKLDNKCFVSTDDDSDSYPPSDED